MPNPRKVIQHGWERLATKKARTTPPHQHSPTPPSPAVRIPLSHSTARAGPNPYAPINLQDLKARLSNRPKILLKDYLSPTHSNMLSLMLTSIVPQHKHHMLLPEIEYRSHPYFDNQDVGPKAAMPLGHHLAYFPPRVPPHLLLRDGTLPEHHPGRPFGRRVWTGGSVFFGEGWSGHFRLDGRLVGCVEFVDAQGANLSYGPPVPVLESPLPLRQQREKEVQEGIEEEGEIDDFLPQDSASESEEVGKETGVRGPKMHRHERLSLDVVRRYGWVMGQSWNQSSLVKKAISEQPLIEERRSLMFFREDDTSTTPDDKVGPKANANHTPYLSYTFIPTPNILTTFSALTLNAHSIHLDRAYTTTVENLPDILVHGPLTLLLLLNLLAPFSVHVRRIDYRNLRPIFVGESVRVCARPLPGTDCRQWKVWIEKRNNTTGEMSIAVKGTAKLGEDFKAPEELVRFEGNGMAFAPKSTSVGVDGKDEGGGGGRGQGVGMGLVERQRQQRGDPEEARRRALGGEGEEQGQGMDEEVGHGGLTQAEQIQLKRLMRSMSPDHSKSQDLSDNAEKASSMWRAETVEKQRMAQERKRREEEEEQVVDPVEQQRLQDEAFKVRVMGEVTKSIDMYGWKVGGRQSRVRKMLK